MKVVYISLSLFLGKKLRVLNITHKNVSFIKCYACASFFSKFTAMMLCGLSVSISTLRAGLENYYIVRTSTGVEFAAAENTILMCALLMLQFEC